MTRNLHFARIVCGDRPTGYDVSESAAYSVATSAKARKRPSPFGQLFLEYAGTALSKRLLRQRPVGLAVFYSSLLRTRATRKPIVVTTPTTGRSR